LTSRQFDVALHDCRGVFDAGENQISENPNSRANGLTKSQKNQRFNNRKLQIIAT
jgi:hypothetical protein